MITILLPITNEAFTLRQMRWANALSGGECRPVVLCTVGDHAEKMIRDKNLQRPAHLHYPPQGLGWAIGGAPSSSAFSVSAKKRFRNYIPSQFIEIFRYLRSLLYFARDLRRGEKLTCQRIAFLCEYIRRERVDGIVLPMANPEHDSPLIIAAARLEGIPVITSPMGRDNKNSYAMIYKTDRTLFRPGLLRCWFKWNYPQWFYKINSIELIRLSPLEALIQERTQIASPIPWDTIGAHEDFVANQNLIDQNFYLQNGVTPSKMEVIGSPEHDQLAYWMGRRSEIREKVFSELALDKSKGVILAALVQTHWISGREEAEFQNYPDMIRAWMAPLLAQTTHNVIISLHPSHRYEDFRYLEKEGIRISRRDFMELLPITDLLIASLSSIIPLAIAAGIPVVNYDVYRYSIENSYLSFSEAKGTITVLDQHQYAQSLLRITEDYGYYAELKAGQEMSAAEWGKLDGQAHQRLVNLMSHLQSGKQP